MFRYQVPEFLILSQVFLNHPVWSLFIVLLTNANCWPIQLRAPNENGKEVNVCLWLKQNETLCKCLPLLAILCFTPSVGVKHHAWMNGVKPNNAMKLHLFRRDGQYGRGGKQNFAQLLLENPSSTYKYSQNDFDQNLNFHSKYQKRAQSIITKVGF